MSESIEVVCPKCGGEIPLGDVNVANDLVLCRKCEHGFSLAEAISEAKASEVDLTNPPKGVWFRRTPTGFELGSSTRSAIAFFLVPFMLLWSGGSVGGIYGRQIAKWDFDLGQSLFGLPFLFGTLLLGAFTIMTICGKFCVRADGKRGEVFIGVGSLGYRKGFHWDRVRDIRMQIKRTAKGRRYEALVIDADSPIGIPSIPKARLSFMLGALRQLHREFFQTAGRIPPKVSEVAGT